MWANLASLWAQLQEMLLEHRNEAAHVNSSVKKLTPALQETLDNHATDLESFRVV